MLTTVKDAVRRTRQHHAIEHATLHLLAARLPGRRMAGYSDAGGFTIFGDVPLDQVRRAVSDALLHLQAGESSLAIHPNCGTNLAVTGIMATAAALVGSRLTGRGTAHVPGERFAAALLLVVPALIIAQPLGLRLQNYTTLASVGDRWIKAIRPVELAGVRAYRVFLRLIGSSLPPRYIAVVYLFLNADEYLAGHRLAELKAALGDPELASLNIAELGPSQVNPVHLLAEAALMPFLTEKRLLIVRGYLDALDKRMAAAKAPGSAAFVEAADLLTRLPTAPETCDLVFVDGAVDKRRSLYKGFTLTAAGDQPERRIPGLEALAKAQTVQLVDLPTPDPKALPAWIQQQVRARKLAIQPDAVALLANFVGRNLRQLDNELEKLSLYAYGRPITAQDVRAMVADASEEMIWNLTDGLCQRNPSKAMHALRDLRRNDQHPLAMLSSISRQYRLLIQVKAMMHRGVMAVDKIAAELGEKSFPVEKAQKLAGLYSFQELDAIMDRLLETDMAMKTGGDEDTLLDVLVADLTSKRAQPAHAPVAPVANPFS